MPVTNYRILFALYVTFRQSRAIADEAAKIKSFFLLLLFWQIQWSK